jgi:hypothetical protein
MYQAAYEGVIRRRRPLCRRHLKSNYLNCGAFVLAFRWAWLLITVKSWLQAAIVIAFCHADLYQCSKKEMKQYQIARRQEQVMATSTGTENKLRLHQLPQQTQQKDP